MSSMDSENNAAPAETTQSVAEVEPAVAVEVAHTEVVPEASATHSEPYPPVESTTIAVKDAVNDVHEADAAPVALAVPEACAPSTADSSVAAAAPADANDASHATTSHADHAHHHHADVHHHHHTHGHQHQDAGPGQHQHDHEHHQHDHEHHQHDHDHHHHRNHIKSHFSWKYRQGLRAPVSHPPPGAPSSAYHVDFMESVCIFGFDWVYKACCNLCDKLEAVCASKLPPATLFLKPSGSRFAQNWQLNRHARAETSDDTASSAATAEQSQPSAEEPFVRVKAHRYVVDAGEYPHSHIYVGLLFQSTPHIHHFADWFASVMRNLSGPDSVILPRLQQQLPNAWGIVNRFYDMSRLQIRGPGPLPHDFENISLTVPFNMQEAEKHYPIILHMMDLLDTIQLVIADDPNLTGKIFAVLRIDARHRVVSITALKRGGSLLWMGRNGLPIPAAVPAPDRPYEVVTYRETMHMVIDCTASLFFNLLSIPLPRFRFQLNLNQEAVHEDSHDSLKHHQPTGEHQTQDSTARGSKGSGAAQPHDEAPTNVTTTEAVAASTSQPGPQPTQQSPTNLLRTYPPIIPMNRRQLCACPLATSILARSQPEGKQATDMIVGNGGDCTTVPGMLSPAFWALKMNSFLLCVKETWRIVLARDHDGNLELSAEVSFPVRGLLSSILEHTWARLVDKRFLFENARFMRDFLLACKKDLENYAATHDAHHHHHHEEHSHHHAH